VVSELATPELTTSSQIGPDSTRSGFCTAPSDDGHGGDLVCTAGEKLFPELNKVVVCGSTTMLKVVEDAGKYSVVVEVTVVTWGSGGSSTFPGP
jgi:hypothetical protein